MLRTCLWLRRRMINALLRQAQSARQLLQQLLDGSSELTRRRHLVCFELLERRHMFAVFVVNDASDRVDFDPFDGVLDVDAIAPGAQISLRAALEAVNDPGNLDPTNRIEFQIAPTNPTGPVVIQLQMDLPALIKSNVTIDGTTQQDTNPDGPDILLDGFNQLTRGIFVLGDINRIQGLQLQHFDYGIAIGPNGLDAGSDPAVGNVITNNVITENNSGGILVGVSTRSIAPLFDTPSTENSIRSNSIFSNFGKAIELSVGGQGSVANRGRIAPLLTGNLVSPGSVRVTGQVQLPLGSLSEQHNLDFYLNPAPALSGFSEGRLFIGTFSFNSLGGTQAFEAMFPATVAAGQFITATLTDAAGNTSEFSNAVLAETLDLIGPNSATVTAGQLLQFSNATQNAIVVQSPQGINFNGQAEIMLSVSAGTLQLGPGSILTDTNGDPRAITIRSTLGELNFALDFLQYVSDVAVVDNLVVVVRAIDGPNISPVLDSLFVPIDVLAAPSEPILNLPPPQNVFSGQTLFFSSADGNAIQIDGNGAVIDGGVGLSLTAPEGTGIWHVAESILLNVIGNDTRSLFLSGSIEAINEVLQTLEFRPSEGFIGDASIGVSFTYQLLGSNQGSVTLNSFTIAVEETPSLSIPDNQQAEQGLALAFSPSNGNAIRVVESSATPFTDMLEITLTVPLGELRLTDGGAAEVIQDDPMQIRVRGTLQQVNLALESLEFVYNFTGAVELEITLDYVQDDAPFLDERLVLIQVEETQFPQVTVPELQQAYFSQKLIFSAARSNAISIDAGGANIAGEVTLIVAVEFGMLSVVDAGGVQVFGNGSDELRLVGTIDAINAVLDGLEYCAEVDGDVFDYLGYDDRVRVTLEYDRLNSEYEPDVIEFVRINLNPEPSLANPAPQQTRTFIPVPVPIEIIDASLPFDGSLELFLTADEGELRVTGDQAGVEIIRDAPGSLRLLGSLAAINLAVDNIEFISDIAGPFDVTATLNHAEDGCRPIAVRILEIQVDRLATPRWEVPGRQNIRRDRSLTFSPADGNGISINLPSALRAGRFSFDVTISIVTGGAGRGAISIAGRPELSNASQSTVRFFGTRAQVIDLLNRLVYRPDPVRGGVASAVLQLDFDFRIDGGVAQSGNAATITIGIAEVPLAPDIDLDINAPGNDANLGSLQLPREVQIGSDRLRLTDVDSPVLDQVTVQVTGPVAGVLTVDTAESGLAAMYDPVTRILTIFDPDPRDAFLGTPAAYESVLQTLKFVLDGSPIASGAFVNGAAALSVSVVATDGINAPVAATARVELRIVTPPFEETSQEPIEPGNPTPPATVEPIANSAAATAIPLAFSRFSIERGYTSSDPRPPAKLINKSQSQINLADYLELRAGAESEIDFVLSSLSDVDAAQLLNFDFGDEPIVPEPKKPKPKVAETVPGASASTPQQANYPPELVEAPSGTISPWFWGAIGALAGIGAGVTYYGGRTVARKFSRLHSRSLPKSTPAELSENAVQP